MAQTAKTEAKKPKTEKVELPAIALNAKALSTDIGPKVLADLDKSNKEEAKAHELLSGVKTKRYDALSSLTLAIIKAAKADKSIDLNAAFPNDQVGSIPRKNRLLDQIGVALGYKELEDTETGQKVTFAKVTHKYFPGPKDKIKSIDTETGKVTSRFTPEGQKKATFRSNFLHMVTKCTQAAAGLMDDPKTDVAFDESVGTLRLTGPIAKTHFGADSVVLNEKLTDTTDGGELKLKAKPSFTKIAEIAAEHRGKEHVRRADSRVTGNVVDTAHAFENLCKTMVTAIEKVDKLTSSQRTALESVVSAAQTKLA